MEGVSGDYLTDEPTVHARTSHLYGEKSRSLLACHANATTAFASLTKILTFRHCLSRSRAVRFPPLCLRDHNLCGLGWLAPAFVNTDRVNLRMIYIAKYHGSLIRR